MMGERKREEGVKGKDSKAKKRIQNGEVEEMRRKQNDEFRSQISLRNEYNTNMCKPSFQGLSDEAPQNLVG